MKFDVIIQCRFRSTRLPGKILLPIFKNLNSLDILIKNLKKIKQINKIILATPNEDLNNIFKNISRKYKIKAYSAKISEANVLKRFYNCAKKFKTKNIIRITSDCPFININLVRNMIKYFKINNLSFLTNNKPRMIPHGFDCEIFSSDILNQIHKKANCPSHKEHVTSWYYENRMHKVVNFQFYKKNFSNIRITLDYYEDYVSFVKNFKIYRTLSCARNSENILNKILKKIKLNNANK